MELTTNADMQTLEMVKKGFINGVFKHPSFIVLHLERVFCGATINIVNINEDNFIVHCQSGKWEKKPYSRMFKFTFNKREHDNIITNIEEIPIE